jgi:hypothetical protein
VGGGTAYNVGRQTQGRTAIASDAADAARALKLGFYMTCTCTVVLYRVFLSGSLLNNNCCFLFIYFIIIFVVLFFTHF